MKRDFQEFGISEDEARRLTDWESEDYWWDADLDAYVPPAMVARPKARPEPEEEEASGYDGGGSGFGDSGFDESGDDAFSDDQEEAAPPAEASPFDLPSGIKPTSLPAPNEKQSEKQSEKQTVEAPAVQTPPPVVAPAPLAEIKTPPSESPPPALKATPAPAPALARRPPPPVKAPSPKPTPVVVQPAAAPKSDHDKRDPRRLPRPVPPAAIAQAARNAVGAQASTQKQRGRKSLEHATHAADVFGRSIMRADAPQTNIPMRDKLRHCIEHVLALDLSLPETDAIVVEVPTLEPSLSLVAFCDDLRRVWEHMPPEDRDEAAQSAVEFGGEYAAFMFERFGDLRDELTAPEPMQQLIAQTLHVRLGDLVPADVLAQFLQGFRAAAIATAAPEDGAE